MKQLVIIPPEIEETVEVGRVCASVGVEVVNHGAGCAIATAQQQQFVAFYDEEKQLRLVQRQIGDSSEWKIVPLNEKLGWDSHNYISMALDPDGCLHLSANMHRSPLRYYRSKTPLDVSEMESLHSMTGIDEQEVTYPQFLRDSAGNLFFMYRSGRSGAGSVRINRYNHQDRVWTALLDKPLLDGEELRNPYCSAPVLGRDGYFHMCWVWRDSPDVLTTHTLCYAKSRDMKEWLTAAGRKIALPIRFPDGDIVDGAEVGSGLINNNSVIGFDHDGTPVISYQKNDLRGKTQIFNARFDGEAWVSVQSTNWDHRWDFEGKGSIEFKVRFGSVAPIGNGVLAQRFWHWRHGNGTLLLDGRSLKAVEVISDDMDLPASLLAVGEKSARHLVPRFVIEALDARGESSWVLRWETRREARDGDTGGKGESSTLSLHKVRRGRIELSGELKSAVDEQEIKRKSFRISHDAILAQLSAQKAKAESMEKKAASWRDRSEIMKKTIEKIPPAQGITAAALVDLLEEYSNKGAQSNEVIFKLQEDIGEVQRMTRRLLQESDASRKYNDEVVGELKTELDDFKERVVRLANDSSAGIEWLEKSIRELEAALAERLKSEGKRQKTIQEATARKVLETLHCHEALRRESESSLSEQVSGLQEVLEKSRYEVGGLKDMVSRSVRILESWEKYRLEDIPRIESLIASLTARSAELAVLAKELVNTREQRDSALQQLNDLRAKIAKLNDDHAKAKELAEYRLASLMECESRMMEVRRELGVLAAAFLKQKTEDEKLRGRLHDSERQLKELRSTLKRRDKEIKKRQKKIEAIRNSTSWRITAPMRFVARVLLRK